MNKQKINTSFKNAFLGFIYTFKTQRNLRIHILFVFFVSLFAYLLNFSLIEWCILLLLFSLVITAELFNTSLEELGNAYSLQHNEYIKKAKDISAAAVLFVSIGAVVIGIILFLPHLQRLIAIGF